MESSTLAFQSFKAHFDALARAGYYKKVFSRFDERKINRHNAYRVVVFMSILAYNVQHIIRVFQVLNSIDKIVDILFILLTTLNALGKQIAFNVKSHRIDRILNVINGPLLVPTTMFHAEAVKSNAVVMSRLLRLYHGAIFACGSLWTVFPLVNRAFGYSVEFTAYFPFNTTTSPGFELALVYMTILITLQAYGNVTMDCTVVAFYAQARTQIQMLRYDFEQLFNLSENFKTKAESMRRNNLMMYKDFEEEIKLQRRLVNCVKHYQKIVWLSKEIESTFGEAMTVQFFVMAWVLCMTVYKIIGLDFFSAEFVSMAMYLGCMLAQLFIYCYFGTQLKSESEFVSQSIYCSDWLDASPRFRRQLLIIMYYCSQPITPRTAYVIPMSLETYITVLKSSYTLFTFLNRK